MLQFRAGLRSFPKSTSPRLFRQNSSSPTISKYADRIQQKLKEEGATDIKELKSKLKDAGKAFEEAPMKLPPMPMHRSSTSTKPSGGLHIPDSRKDSSPLKPLSSFLNVSALLKTPHTAEQISALWTVYHASRSNNTGRGYLSATIPVETYEAMLVRARKWPMFVLPVPHPDQLPEPNEQQGAQVPVEFHFLEWNFFSPPPVPSPSTEADPFPLSPPKAFAASPNPHTASAVFTPLVQYKLHQSYAPPYFIMNHYTDFAQTHGIVLLRGEITPSSVVSAASHGGASEDGRFMMTQRDAQILALGVQQFYLPVVGADDKMKRRGELAEELLRSFHEKPEAFQWEKLLNFTDAGLVV